MRRIVGREAGPRGTRHLLHVFVVEQDRVLSLKVAVRVARVHGIGRTAPAPGPIAVAAALFGAAAFRVGVSPKQGGDDGRRQRGARPTHTHHDHL